MERPFRVGDRVRRTRGIFHAVTEGWEGVVTRIRDTHNLIELEGQLSRDGTPSGFDERCFELVSRASVDMNFKVGDKVISARNTSGVNYEVLNLEWTITSINIDSRYANLSRDGLTNTMYLVDLDHAPKTFKAARNFRNFVIDRVANEATV